MVEKKLQDRDLDTLTAKVFSLAYQYDEQVLNNDGLVRNWSAWLGTAEYRLGQKISNPKAKNILFNKSLEHLLKAREKGDGSRQNASFIGSCYYRLGKYGDALKFLLESRKKGSGSKENASLIGNCHYRLGKYEDALPFFLESRKKGNERKENASLIGSCYFELSRFTEGIWYYETAIQSAQKDDFNHAWMRAFDEALGHSFNLLVRAKESIQSPIYDNLLQRFNSLYTGFITFWREKEPGINIHPKLMFDGRYNPPTGVRAV